MSDKNNSIDDKEVEKKNHNKITDKYKYNKACIGMKLDFGYSVIYDLTDNVDNMEIMQTVGYDQAKIANFITIYKTTKNAVDLQRIKLNDSIFAQVDFKKLLAISKDELRYLCKVAKIALRDHPQKIDKLKLNTKRGVSIADVLTFMENLYSQILNDSEILDLLSAFNYKKERISAFYNNYILTREAYKNYCTISSEAIESTRVRDLQMVEFNKWMLDYYTLFKVAYQQLGR